jgi:hypothetical protein
MTTKDRGRKWMWCFVGALVTLPFYFVRELIAAFALFAIGFAAIAFVIVSLYMLQKGWEVAVARIVDTERLAAQGFEARRSTRWMP